MPNTITRAGHVRDVIGTDVQLQAVIGGLEARGHRVEVHQLRRTPGGKVRCILVVGAVVREPAPVPARRPWWQHRWPYLTAGGLLAVAGLGAATIWLVRAVIAHPGLAVGAGVLAVLLLAGIFRACCAVCGR